MLYKEESIEERRFSKIVLIVDIIISEILTWLEVSIKIPPCYPTKVFIAAKIKSIASKNP